MKQIDPSDLRLGNWVYESDKSKFPMQIESIGKNWIYLDFEGNEGDVFENSDKDIYPIPLTVELFHFLSPIDAKRFHDNVYGFDTGRKDFRLHINNKMGKFYFYIDNEVRVEMKYVHQLQNLYNVLTGKELEIKQE